MLIRYPVTKGNFINKYNEYKNKYSVIDIHENDLEFNIRYSLSKYTSKSMQEVDYCILKWIH